MKSVLLVVAFVVTTDEPQLAELRASADRAFAQEQWDKAIVAYTDVLRLAPDDVRALNRRGIARQIKGEYAKAIADHTEAIRLAPKDVSGYHNRAMAHVELKALDKALADYDAAIRCDPTAVNSVYGRALVWIEKSEHTKAVSDLAIVLRLDPKYERAFYARATAFRGLGKTERAVSDLTEMLRLNPKAADAHQLRGEIHQQSRSFDKALKDFDEAVRLEPTNAEALAGRAFIRATCPDPKYRDGKGAVVDATRACVLTKWDRPKLLEVLAAACAEAGDFDTAVRWQKKAASHPAYAGAEAARALAGVKRYENKMPYRDGIAD